MRSTLALALAVAERDDLRHFNEFLDSLPVQLALLGLWIALAVLAFVRVRRDFDDARSMRLMRAVIVALGVFLVCVLLLPVALWLQIIAVLWLFAMWLYYFARFLTTPRSGPRNPVAQARGRALDDVLKDERGTRGGGPAPDDPSAS